MGIGIRTYIRKHLQAETVSGRLLRFLLRKKLPPGQLPLQLGHLKSYPEEDAMGPLQRSEALFLYALVRVIRPRLLVEFGFHDGHSAVNFLKAGGPKMFLHSYDISPKAEKIAKSVKKRYPNFQFHLKSQVDFSPADVGDRPIDVVFIDASHDLKLNQLTWNALEASLAPNAIVLIHDTGTWSRDQFRPVNKWFEETKAGYWLTPTEYVHQADERMFSNWILGLNRGFVAIHLHSLAVLRHGLTILQRGGLLPVDQTRTAT